MNKAYEEITKKIINQLEQGTIPWEQPWFGVSGAISYATGKAYSLLNQLILGGESGEYLTWHQIQEHKAHLRKGSRGRRVFFWNTFDKAEKNNDGEITIKKVPYLKTYTVFSVDDCEGIAKRWIPKVIANADNKPIELAEATIKQYLEREKIELKHSNDNRSYYSVKYDYVNVPPLQNFKSSSDYYGTLCHELIHSTGHESRLNRFKLKDKNSAFGSNNYSREELVAELGSSFLLKQFNISTNKTLEQNAAYIKSWIKALSNDYSLIPIAASKAEKAVQYLLAGKAE